MGVGSVLIVCGKQDFLQEITNLMIHDGFGLVESALSANEARRKLNALDLDLVIVNTPLPDEQGTDLVLDLSHKTTAGILVLVKHEHLNEIQYQLEKTGALILPKPITKITLKQTARFALNSRRSINNLMSQNDDLQRRMNERKNMEKAKWLVVENLKMTESQAHRHIQKMAMDLRISQNKVAEEIIKKFS